MVQRATSTRNTWHTAPPRYIAASLTRFLATCIFMHERSHNHCASLQTEREIATTATAMYIVIE
jgi:hypothetical protein